MKDKTKSILFFSIAFAFMTTAVFGGGLYYVISKGNSLIALRQTIAEHTAKENSYIFIQNLEAETEEEREELTNFFISKNEQETLRLINELETLATIMGVTIETTGLDIKVPVPPPANADGTQPVATDTYERLQINLEVEGSSTAVRRYVSVLENLPYDKRMEKIALRRDNENSGLWLGEVELSLTLLP